MGAVIFHREQLNISLSEEEQPYLQITRPIMQRKLQTDGQLFPALTQQNSRDIMNRHKETH
jgi:hypothetical protein